MRKIKRKMLAILLQLLMPVIIVVLFILIIVSPLLLFMGEDTGDSYELYVGGVRHVYTNDIRGWARYLATKNAQLQQEIKAKEEGSPETEGKNGSSIEAYSDVTEYFYTSEGDVTYITDNSKELISMMMVRFAQEYSDGLACFSYLNDMFDNSHHVKYKESDLYGCTNGCAERKYYCSEEPTYDDCFRITSSSEERKRKHDFYITRGGCEDNYVEQTFYCNEEIAKGVVASDYRRGLVEANLEAGGCTQLHHNCIIKPAFRCNNYETPMYLQKLIKRESGMPKKDISYKWSKKDKCWQYKNGGKVYEIAECKKGDSSYLTREKNGDTLKLKYNVTSDNYEFYNFYYKCKERTCPGHTETVPGECLGNHVEKVCYGHVDLQVRITVDLFPKLYDDDYAAGDLGWSVAGESLGTFTITGYCPCSKCCGKYANGYTATGTLATEGRTIAVDPKVIPYGTKVVIDGHVYVAEDCGGGVKNKHIDMFFNDHQAALNWGKQEREVYLADGTGVTDGFDDGKTENEDDLGLEPFVCWDEESRQWVECLYDMDWLELYDVNIGSMVSTTIDDSTISGVLDKMPEGTDEVRKSVVQTAVGKVGLIPYKWGGTATGPGDDGIPGGGLDCSHFVDWVFWTATGNNLGNGNTQTLWGVSEKIDVSELQPGDIGFRYKPAAYGGVGGADGHTNHVGIYVGQDENGNQIWVHENGSAHNVSAGPYKGFKHYRRVLN